MHLVICSLSLFKSSAAILSHPQLPLILRPLTKWREQASCHVQCLTLWICLVVFLWYHFLCFFIPVSYKLDVTSKNLWIKAKHFLLKYNIGDVLYFLFHHIRDMACDWPLLRLITDLEWWKFHLSSVGLRFFFLATRK